MTNLVKYDAMCRAIEAAHAVDEVKDIRDRAVALEHYARQAQNIDAERHAAEIRLRAERKVGQLLAAMNKATGGRNPAPDNQYPEGTGYPPTPPTLKELGISKVQSSRWQKLGAMPPNRDLCDHSSWTAWPDRDLVQPPAQAQHHHHSRGERVQRASGRIDRAGVLHKGSVFAEGLSRESKPPLAG